MARWRSTIGCAQAAQWLSLELDGELSELERAALAAHLERCAECRDARTELRAVTSLIREAPLEPPHVRVVVPARRVPRRERRARRVAAAVAVGAVFASALALFVGPHGASNRSSSGLAAASRAQRLQFAAAEHARTDPQAPPPSVAVLSPYALRALFGSF
jgi:predicted anti-sigma-YlaC factor YlaD